MARHARTRGARPGFRGGRAGYRRAALPGLRNRRPARRRRVLGLRAAPGVACQAGNGSVDSAVMVIDAAKGIETQTRKLFEVCRLRDVPIATFINKMDRDGRDPFELLDEIAHDLQLEVTPASWPIGMGREFLGCYDLFADQLILMERTRGEYLQEGITVAGLTDPKLDELLPATAVAKLRDDVAM